MVVIFETPRLFLRRFTEEDAQSHLYVEQRS